MEGAIAMKFNSKKLKTFYRCYILPRHIAKAATGSDRETSLMAELDRRETDVARNEAHEELAEYITRQDEKQAAYDASVAAHDAHDQDPTDLTGPAMVKALGHLADVRAAFTADYH